MTEPIKKPHGNTGKKRSHETIEKMRRAMLGNQHNKGKKNANGHKPTPEVNLKKSIRHTGKKVSSETKEKMSKASLGRTFSDLTRQRLSEAQGKQIEIDGVVYPSCAAAGRSFNVTGPTVRNRCNNDLFPTWKYVDVVKTKP